MLLSPVSSPTVPEPYRSTRERVVDGAFGHDRLARARGCRDQHGLARVERLQGAHLEVVERESVARPQRVEPGRATARQAYSSVVRRRVRSQPTSAARK